jgi:hypothetical protein
MDKILYNLPQIMNGEATEGSGKPDNAAFKSTYRVRMRNELAIIAAQRMREAQDTSRRGIVLANEYKAGPCIKQK